MDGFVLAMKYTMKLLKHKAVVATGIYTALAFMFFFSILFGGKSYLSADSNATGSLTAPLAAYHEKTGEMPLWSPYVFCGMPSYGSMMYNGQVYMPGYIFMPISKILPKLFFVLHYIFAGLGVFLFLKRRKIDDFSAFFGGLVFMFMPYMIAMFAHGHGSQMMTAAYLPWMLWSTDRLLEKMSVRNIAISVLIFGFALQRGHIQIFYYGVLLSGLYLMFKVTTERNLKQYAILFVGFGIVLVMALSLAAMVYLPVGEYVPYSIRGGTNIEGEAGVGLKYATEWKIAPKEFLTFLIPSFYGFGGETYHGTMPFTDFPNYAGILVLLLAFAGIFYSIRYKNNNRLLVIFLVSSTLLVILLSFGGSFYKIFYNYFPYWNKFRVPSMLLILSNLNLSILAGLGLHELSKRKIEEKYLWASWAVLILTLLVLFSAGQAIAEKSGLTMPQFSMLHQDAFLNTLFLVSGIILLLFLQYEKVPFYFVATGICIITLIDLWQVDNRIGVRGMEQKAIEQESELVKFFKADTSIFRVFPSGKLFAGNELAEFGIESIGGYHAAKPRLYQDLLEALDKTKPENQESILGMMNAKYRIAIMSDGGVGIYYIRDRLPRAYMVGTYEVETNPKKRLEKMTNGFDFRHKVILSTNLNVSVAPDSTAQAILLKSDYSLNHIRINVSNQKTQFLVLTDGYYPIGWQAYIDGYPVKTYRANHAFCAVCVPGGAKTVEFKYVSKAYRNGWIISIVTLLICLATIAIPERRR